MTYTLGIPADGQSLGNSKPQVRNNFTNIFNTFAINHVGYNATSHSGMHSRVDLLNGPDLVSPSGTDTLYSKIAAGVGELFFIRPGGTPIQMTTNNPVIGVHGSSFLPGGIIVKWGSDPVASNITPITFSDTTSAFPNNIFFVIAQPYTTNVNKLKDIGYATDGGTITGFNFLLNQSPININNFSWIAVGN